MANRRSLPPGEEEVDTRKAGGDLGRSSQVLGIHPRGGEAWHGPQRPDSWPLSIYPPAVQWSSRPYGQCRIGLLFIVVVVVVIVINVRMSLFTLCRTQLVTRRPHRRCLTGCSSRAAPVQPTSVPSASLALLKNSRTPAAGLMDVTRWPHTLPVKAALPLQTTRTPGTPGSPFKLRSPVSAGRRDGRRIIGRRGRVRHPPGRARRCDWRGAKRPDVGSIERQHAEASFLASSTAVLRAVRSLQVAGALVALYATQ
ncbi:hypothetical protein G7046_g8909 [Stylonectria norvegica]|nr:hypothetical protein G7046_g8909 [Stylonectria norvegica]